MLEPWRLWRMNKALNLEDREGWLRPRSLNLKFLVVHGLACILLIKQLIQVRLL